MLSEGEYTVTIDGEPAGTVNISRRGLMTHLSFRGALPQKLWRLAALGRGRAVSVGIPAPMGELMALERDFSALELERMGLSAAEAFILVPASEDLSAINVKASPADSDTPPAGHSAEASSDVYEGPGYESDVPELAEETAFREDGTHIPAGGDDLWRPLDDPGAPFADMELAGSAREAEGVMYRREGGDLVLSFPWSPQAPLPMAEIFRFLRPVTLGGAPRMLLRLRDGIPVLE